MIAWAACASSDKMQCMYVERLYYGVGPGGCGPGAMH